MGYLHIENLYRPEAQKILEFKRLYAMEKIHGTSTHISYRDGHLTFSSGGETHNNFVALFDQDKLLEKLQGHENSSTKITIYGEAYGGKQQRNAWRYGNKLKFVAFDVLIEYPDGDSRSSRWFSVPEADAFVTGLGLEFVHYTLVPSDLASLDAERDAPSEQARRNGVEGDQPREGVVLRPPWDFDLNGSRMIVKHKRLDERETNKIRVAGEKLEVLNEGPAIANEWVTQTRLEHVLQKLLTNGEQPDLSHIPLLLPAMEEDIAREGSGEFVPSPAASKAIRVRTVQLFRQHLNDLVKQP